MNVCACGVGPQAQSSHARRGFTAPGPKAPMELPAASPELSKAVRLAWRELRLA